MSRDHDHDPMLPDPRHPLPVGVLRSGPAREMRSAAHRAGIHRRADGTRTITGLAIVYDKWSVDLGGFREIIKPGAARRVIREQQDVRCLGHHDVGFVLGRTRSGTLTLREDAEGLHFECVPPNNPRANELMDSLERGDLDACSFAFDIPANGARWIIPNDPNMPWEREIYDLIVYEVSIVAFPAYLDTSAAVRELEFQRRSRFAAPSTPVAPIDPLNLRLQLAMSRARS